VDGDRAAWLLHGVPWKRRRCYKTGKVLVVGGNDQNNPLGLASAELYDPATGVWTATR